MYLLIKMVFTKKLLQAISCFSWKRAHSQRTGCATLLPFLFSPFPINPKAVTAPVMSHLPQGEHIADSRYKDSLATKFLL